MGLVQDFSSHCLEPLGSKEALNYSGDQPTFGNISYRPKYESLC